MMASGPDENRPPHMRLLIAEVAWSSECPNPLQRPRD